MGSSNIGEVKILKFTRVARGFQLKVVRIVQAATAHRTRIRGIGASVIMVTICVTNIVGSAICMVISAIYAPVTESVSRFTKTIGDATVAKTIRNHPRTKTVGDGAVAETVGDRARTKSICNGTA